MVNVDTLLRNRNNSKKIEVNKQTKIRDFFSSYFFLLLITILFFSSTSVSISYFTLSFFSRFLDVNFLSLSSFDFFYLIFLSLYVILPLIFYFLIYFIICKYYGNFFSTIQKNMKYPLHIYNLLAIFFLILFVFMITLVMKNQYLATIPLHVMFITFPIFFIFVIEKKNFDEFIHEIKLDNFRFLDVLRSIVFFIALLMLLAIFSFLFMEYRQSHQSSMITLIKSLNTLLLIFAIFLAPITEELFFRAFLSKRFGILNSSILFAIFHINYMSLIQFFASFLIGLALALIFKRYNLNTCIYIHLLFNLTSIVVVMFFL